MSKQLQNQRYIGKQHFPLPEPLPGFRLFVFYKVSRGYYPLTTDLYREHNGKWIDLFKVGEGIDISRLDQETLEQIELKPEFYRRKTILRVNLVVHEPAKAIRSIIEEVLSALASYMPLQLGYEIISHDSHEAFVAYVLLIKEASKNKKEHIKKAVKQLSNKFTNLKLDAKVFEPSVTIENLPKTVSWLNGM